MMLRPIGTRTKRPVKTETTPTPTSGGGSLSAASSSVFAMKISNRVFFTANVTITTNGSGTTYIQVVLPYIAAETTAANGANAGDGSALSGLIDSGTANLRIFKYDATYPAVSGSVLLMSGSYRTA